MTSEEAKTMLSMMVQADDWYSDGASKLFRLFAEAFPEFAAVLDEVWASKFRNNWRSE